VEAFAQGDKTNLELFIDILQQGTSFYRVDEMKLIWEHAERDYSDFPLSNKCN
jgi:acylphosphatase